MSPDDHVKRDLRLEERVDRIERTQAAQLSKNMRDVDREQEFIRRAEIQPLLKEIEVRLHALEEVIVGHDSQLSGDSVMPSGEAQSMGKFLFVVYDLNAASGDTTVARTLMIFHNSDRDAGVSEAKRWAKSHGGAVFMYQEQTDQPNVYSGNSETFLEAYPEPE